VATPSRRHFGSARKLPSGRWQASYWHEGVRHNAPTTFASKADVLAFLSTVEADLRRGAWLDPRSGQVTFGELAKEWLTSNPAKRSSTMARDEAILRNHLVPVLGDVPISSVTKLRVQQLINAWAPEAAPRTVRRQFDVLRAVFAYAVANEMLPRTPCGRAKLPAAEIRRRVVLAPEDIAAIADAMREEYRGMVWVGAVLGLRWGEVAGLQVQSLDFEQGAVIVTSQLDRDGKLAPPKSGAGVRTLSTPGALMDLLAAHIEARGLTTGKSDALVFVAPEGGPIDYTTWRRRFWLPAAAAAGFPGLGFHDLRRAATTALVVEGVDIKTAQTRLGHSDPRLTIAVYARPPPRRTARRLTSSGRGSSGRRLLEVADQAPADT
jgi:integrase